MSNLKFWKYFYYYACENKLPQRFSTTVEVIIIDSSFSHRKFSKIHINWKEYKYIKEANIKKKQIAKKNLYLVILLFVYLVRTPK
jgi:hypothetical protein